MQIRADLLDSRFICEKIRADFIVFKVTFSLKTYKICTYFL